ncbi:MAG: BTAD domain-containing putative transcriptional regulator [Burkholderiales bacterium]|nr:BTAD domain-containing putative transcriptional regulator [Burkholderiales bacterium]
MARFTIRLLGPFEVVGPAGVADLGRGKLCGLVALLACAAEGRSREALSNLLWGSHFDVQAQQNLRQAIARLRQILGRDALVADTRTVALAPGLFDCDLTRFERLLAAGTPACTDEALGLFGGLLTDVVIRDPGWADWIRGERLRLETTVLDALVSRGDHLLSAGDASRALAFGRRATGMDALREDAHRLVIRALSVTGRRAEALRQLDEITGLLRKSLGVAPDPATLALAESIRRAAEAPTVAASSVTVASAIESVHAAFRGAMALSFARSSASDLDRMVQLVAPHGGALARADAREALLTFPDVRAAVAAALGLKGAGNAATGIGIDLAGLPDAAQDPFARARRLAAAAGEGILATGDVCAALTDDLDAEITDAGQVGASAFEPGLRAYRLSHPTRRPFAAEPMLWPSVAVVPFLTSGGEPGLAGIGDVLADEVIVALARSSELTVISRLSTAALRSRDMPFTDMRGLIGANYVLSGRCHVVGTKLRLAVEFADTRTGQVQWAEAFSLDVADFVEPAEIALALAARVATTVAQVEVRNARSGTPATLEDSTLLIGAISLMHQLSLPKFELARELLETLAARAPRRAAPHAWLAMLSVLRTSQGWSTDLAGDARLALDNAARALDAEPDCSLALAVDGHVNTHYLKRFDIAEDRFDLAVEAGPNDALAWLLKSTLHTFRGEGTPALGAADRALRLSPLDPRRWYYDALAASAAVSAGDYERAIDLARRSIRSNRTHSSSFRALTIALSLGGREEEARQAAGELLRLQPDLTVSSYRERHPSGAFAIGATLADALRRAGVPE